MDKLTRKQIKWLESRGGRTLKDVKQGKLGPYVFMGDGQGGQKKVYIPNKDCEVCKELYWEVCKNCEENINN